MTVLSFFVSYHHYLSPLGFLAVGQTNATVTCDAHSSLLLTFQAYSLND